MAEVDLRPSLDTQKSGESQESLESLRDYGKLESEDVDAKKSKINGQFFNVERKRLTVTGVQNPWERCRIRLERVLQSSVTDTFLGLVILADVILGIMEIDGVGNDPEAMAVMTGVTSVCFGIYVIELSMQFFLRGWKTFHDQWTVLDMAVVFGGTLDLAVQLANVDVSQLGLVRFLRMFRIVRLMRIFRKFGSLKELSKLVKMARSCLKTLFWSFIFCFMLMTIWSMIAVQLMRPIAEEMYYEQGVWEDCPLCVKSLSTVMSANLMFFKTIVAGDEWGLLADPIIAQHPWTALIFVGAQLTIVFGVLNLVVAVVVDEFAEKRSHDYMTQAVELDEEFEKDLGTLGAIFHEIDLDGDSELTMQELAQGARTIPEFRNRLRVMDIDESDLGQLFTMLDEDSNGTIDAGEFKGALSRWLHESKTASRFVKYSLVKVIENQDVMRHSLSKVGERVERLLKHRRKEAKSMAISQSSSPGSPSSPHGDSGVSEISFSNDHFHGGSVGSVASQEDHGASAASGHSSSDHEQDASNCVAKALRQAELALAEAILAGECLAKESLLEHTLSAAKRAQQESVQELAKALERFAEQAGERSNVKGEPQKQQEKFSDFSSVATDQAARSQPEELTMRV